jgi:thiol-disulfide isomerase/thioredoxin
MKCFRFFIVFIICLQLYPKPLIAFQALRIGEKVPNVNLGVKLANAGIINHLQDTLKVSDFHGTPLILDFWTSTCGTCILSFPELEDLQDKFRKKLTILSIGFAWKRENNMLTGDITDLIKEWQEAGKRIRVPVTKVVESRVSSNPESLSSLFPFISVPTVIWIDSSGYFRAISSKESLTEENIEMFLNGKEIVLKKKFSEKVYDPSIPLLLRYNRGNGNETVFKFAVSSYNDTLGSQILRAEEFDDSVYHVYAINTSLSSLYEVAFKRIDNSNSWIDRKRTWFKSPINICTDFINPLPNIELCLLYMFLRNNVFCYEAIIPKRQNSISEISRKIVDQLNEYWEIKTYIAPRSIRCLELRSVNDKTFRNKTNRKLKQFSSSYEFGKSGESLIRLDGIYLSNLVNQLNVQLPSSIPYIIDPTDSDFQLDIKLPYKIKDLKTLIHYLNEAGLKVIESEISIPVLVIEI